MVTEKQKWIIFSFTLKLSRCFIKRNLFLLMTNNVVNLIHTIFHFTTICLYKAKKTLKVATHLFSPLTIWRDDSSVDHTEKLNSAPSNNWLGQQW